ncbi:hypothetical protein ABS768_01845 [Flavobacterium sp. ST-75]|uniref:Preprotein translocase subunit SecD n=1 Tax=Flavobacterium rhizophilum TaxID=3163296 RepID=A0ABW8YAD7_9FLAO
MKAEELLPDNQNQVTINGQEIRKGSIGAFLLNCKTVINLDKNSNEYKTAMSNIKEQALLLEKIGLFEVFEVKIPEIREALINS